MHSEDMGFEYKPRTRGPADGKHPARYAFRGAALMSALVLLSGLACGTEEKQATPSAPAPPVVQPQQVPPKYDFEDSLTSWIPQDYRDSRACVAVRTCTTVAKVGHRSLEMSMNLIAQDAESSKGEAWVDMLQHPPVGLQAPLDLTGRTIAVWVYAPHGAAGEQNAPNGFQVFVKDSEWRGQYGKWHDIDEGEWMPVTLTVSAQTPTGGWRAEGFNPREVIAVGLKMAAGGASSARYRGPLYVDAVDW